MKLDTTAAPGFGLVLKFKHFFMPLRRFQLTAMNKDQYRCDVICEVPDRDAGSPKFLHWARFINRSLTDAEIATDIYREVQNMFAHEFAESWHIDGVRVYDPHD